MFPTPHAFTELTENKENISLDVSEKDSADACQKSSKRVFMVRQLYSNIKTSFVSMTLQQKKTLLTRLKIKNDCNMEKLMPITKVNSLALQHEFL